MTTAATPSGRLAATEVGARRRLRAHVRYGALSSLEQPDGGDLLEVLERNPLAAIEAPRDRVGKRQVVADQAFAGPRFAVVGVEAEICCFALG
jgi:hypothetical protein